MSVTQRGRGGRKAGTIVEPLEGRRLLSISLGADGTLAVVGSDSVDLVDLTESGTSLTAKLGAAVQTFARTSVARIDVRVFGAGDTVRLGASVPTAVDLGDGDDALERAGVNIPVMPTLSALGGAGNDRVVLSGAFTAATFDGGPGADELVIAAPLRTRRSPSPPPR